MRSTLELLDACLRGEAVSKEELEKMRTRELNDRLEQFPIDIRDNIVTELDPAPPTWTARFPATENVSPVLELEHQHELQIALEDMTYDCHTLQAVTGGHALLSLWQFILETDGLINRLGLDRDKVRAFGEEVEVLYHPLPYHNALHAAGVLLAMYHLLHGCAVHEAINDIPTDLVLLSAYTACVVHDLDHPGVTNSLLVSTGDARALRYNDQSVNEHHHLARFFGLLESPTLNIFESIGCKGWQIVRHLIIGMVLKTDMHYHFSVVRECENCETGVPSLLLLQATMKLADISHACILDWKGHQRWTDKMKEELWLQGDTEKRLGMPVSVIMDRSKTAFISSQSGFFDVFVLPLLEALRKHFPGAEPWLARARSNRNRWKSFAH